MMIYNVLGIRCHARTPADVNLNACSCGTSRHDTKRHSRGYFQTGHVSVCMRAFRVRFGKSARPQRCSFYSPLHVFSSIENRGFNSALPSNNPIKNWPGRRQRIFAPLNVARRWRRPMCDVGEHTPFVVFVVTAMCVCRSVIDFVIIITIYRHHRFYLPTRRLCVVVALTHEPIAQHTHTHTLV